MINGARLFADAVGKKGKTWKMKGPNWIKETTKRGKISRAGGRDTAD